MHLGQQHTINHSVNDTNGAYQTEPTLSYFTSLMRFLLNKHLYRVGLNVIVQTVPPMQNQVSEI